MTPASATVAPVDDAWVTELAARLIAAPGHEDLPQYERDVAVALRDALAAEGVAVGLVDIGAGRCNVVARVGRADGRRMMLTGHLDTVPGYGMADPFVPAIDGGRLRGRGAVDMKGALACMAGALVALHRAAGPLTGEVLFAAVAGEEKGSAGTRHLAAAGPRADFAIVGEPTRLDVVVAHKGAMWVEVEFTGRAAHGSRPELGVNAVSAAARFVAEVEHRLRPQLDRRTHPLLGRATVNVGVIAGGDRPPMVPARCVVQLDRRWLPAEQHAAVLDELDGAARAVAAGDPELCWAVREMAGTSGFVHHPLDCPPDAPGLAELEAAVADVTGAPARRCGAAFWTDAALLSREGGVPSVVCGPGDIAQAHADDEFVELEQLAAATRVYLRAAERFLSG